MRNIPDNHESDLLRNDVALHPKIAEFDILLAELPPHKRAGYIDSFYAQNRDNNDTSFIISLALLMRRWSSKINGANFRSHAAKLAEKVILSDRIQELLIQKKMSEGIWACLDSCELDTPEESDTMEVSPEIAAVVNSVTSQIREVLASVGQENTDDISKNKA